MIPAAILSAGRSTRMGVPKALLPDREGRPFVVRLASTLSEAGVDDLVVVVGTEADRIGRALDAARVGVRLVRNDDPAADQLSSLIAALRVIDHPGIRALLVALVDVPLVAPHTVTRLLDTARTTHALIVRPERNGRHGHPVIFDQRLFAELRRADPAEGAKAIVHAHREEIVNVRVEDEGAFADIDTPEDYERVIGRRFDRVEPVG